MLFFIHMENSTAHRSTPICNDSHRVVPIRRNPHRQQARGRTRESGHLNHATGGRIRGTGTPQAAGHVNCAQPRKVNAGHNNCGPPNLRLTGDGHQAMAPLRPGNRGHFNPEAHAWGEQGISTAITPFPLIRTNVHRFVVIRNVSY